MIKCQCQKIVLTDHLKMENDTFEYLACLFKINGANVCQLIFITFLHQTLLQVFGRALISNGHIFNSINQIVFIDFEIF